MQKEDPSLRVEANSIPNDALSESQREAFKQIVHSLAETVRDLKTPNGAKDHQGTDGVDDDRKSRTVMISGDRGTGKTTLMLTLQNRITKDRTPIDEKEFGLDCKTQLEEIRGRIVWLEPLDMEHSSNTTNLFVSILARIDDAIKACFRDGYRGDDPYGMSVSTIPGSDDVLMELRRLEVDASLAWEGNLVARAPSLDSDAYATEVMRAERARMKINPRFRDLLEKIATRLHWGPKISNPIFVLAVDDFDLNPSRCLDILKLIRSLNVPRLFTLVLGDEEVAEEVFRLDIQGVMSRIANVAIDARDGASSSFIKRIKHISPQAVRKLVPPHQRLRLKYNTVEQSLNIKPANAKKSIEGLLEEFILYAELPAGKGVVKNSGSQYLQYSLYDFLVRSIPDFMFGGKADELNLPQSIINRYRYKAARILETSIREVIDLWFALNRVLETGKSHLDWDEKECKKLLIAEIRKLVRRAVYDDAYLSLESAERFIYDFESDFDFESFRTYELELLLPLPLSHQVISNKFDSGLLTEYASVRLNYIEEFKLIYTNDEVLGIAKPSRMGASKGEAFKNRWHSSNSIINESNNLSRKTQSHLVFLHDLIVTNPLAPVLGNHLVKPVGEYGIATCDWSVSGIGKISIPWRGAIFRTIRELEIFSNSWDVFLERSRDRSYYQGTVPVDLAAKAWLILNLTTLLGDMRLDHSLNIDFLFFEDEELHFSVIRDLMKRVCSLSVSSDQLGKSRAGWTIEGLFANFYPGSGFGLDLCKNILSDDDLRVAYAKSMKRINEIRMLAFAGNESKIQDFYDVFMVTTNVWRYLRSLAKHLLVNGDFLDKIAVGNASPKTYERILIRGIECLTLNSEGRMQRFDMRIWKRFIQIIERCLDLDNSLFYWLPTDGIEENLNSMNRDSAYEESGFSPQISTVEDMKRLLAIVKREPYLVDYCTDYQIRMKKLISG